MPGRYGSMTYAQDHKPADGHAWAVCWCERGVVELPFADVGLTTRSCGRADCEESNGSQPATH